MIVSETVASIAPKVLTVYQSSGRCEADIIVGYGSPGDGVCEEGQPQREQGNKTRRDADGDGQDDICLQCHLGPHSKLGGRLVKQNIRRMSSVSVEFLGCQAFIETWEI